MRYIGTIFGCFIFLAALPFLLQEPENFEPVKDIDCEFERSYMIGLRTYDVCFDSLDTDRKRQLYELYYESK